MLFRLIALVLFVTVGGWAAAQKPSAGKEDPLAPRPVPLTTRDGAKLQSYYFPTDRGKESVPVLLIHEWKGQAGAFLPLIQALTVAGHPVLAIEYRGHGNSRQYVDASGKEQEYNPARMSKNDIEAIIKFDLEEAKQFLKAENNAGRVNLNALVVVGVGEGAILGGLWSMRDWAFRSVGRLKQGQDVKGLIYISPERNLQGVPIEPALRDPNLLRLPTMIVAGGQSDQARDVERVASRIEAAKKRAGGGTAAGFEMLMVPTPLSGAALVVNGPGVIAKIVAFIDANITSDATINPWVERP